MNDTATPSRAPGLVLLLGAILVIVSGFLAWFGLTFAGGSDDLKGFDLTMGVGAVVISAVVLILAILVIVGVGRRALSITAIVLSAILLIIGAYAAFDPEGAITSFEAGSVADEFGITQAQAEAALEQAFANGDLSATGDIGAYVAAIGSLLALSAAIWGTAAYKKRTLAVPPPPPPAGAYPAAPPGPAPTAPQWTPPPAGPPPGGPPPAAPPAP